MKKVLFIGTYRQQDSWGEDARDIIMSLLTNKEIQLATRPIYYTNFIESNIHPSIISCENSSYEEYDIILQFAIPGSFYIGQRGKKNVGIVNVEFSKGQSITNSLLLNKLDEIYVHTEAEKKALISCSITTPIKVIPKPINLDIISNNINKSIHFPSVIDSTFKFYCRHGHNERSNLAMLITAFNIAFSEMDKVSLIIAPSGDASNPPSAQKAAIEQLSKQIKSSLHTNKVFKNEIIIADNFNSETIMSVHNACDCFINITSGCNFDKETLIAYHLGKTPIVSQHTGLETLVDGDKGGFIVKSENYPIMLSKPPLPEVYDLFNAKYYWRTPMLSSLVETMQKVFYSYKNDYKAYQTKKYHGSDKINQYSYTNIGQYLCT